MDKEQSGHLMLFDFFFSAVSLLANGQFQILILKQKHYNILVQNELECYSIFVLEIESYTVDSKLIISECR